MRISLRLAAMLVAFLALPLAIPASHAADAGASPLDALARDTERVESLRAVRNLQYAYSHYAQFGLWEEMGALFASDGEVVGGDKGIKGPAAIARYHRDTYGAGKPGLPKGVMNSLFIDVPLSNLSADGNTAAVRWYGLHMRGGGAEARWESGTFENEYVNENGVWKISRLRFHPQFGGLYEAGAPTDQTVPNTQYTTYQYADGIELHCDLRNWYTGPAEAQGLFVYGAKGWMKVGNDKAEVFLGRRNEPGPVITADEKVDSGQIHFQNFIDAMRSRKVESLHAPLEEGHLSTSLCHLGNISYRVGRSVKFDGATERFVGDSEADALLTRTYRAPYVLPDKT